MKQSITIFFLACLVSCIYGTEEIQFIKTIEGERFNNNLIPSLTVNVSYIQATDKSNRPISYSLNSKYFKVNSKGQIFLVAFFDNNDFESKTQVTIRASNSIFTKELNNTVTVTDVNDKPPEFVSPERVFKISEDYPISSKIVDSSGNHIEIHLRDPDSANTDLYLTCENTVAFPDVCNIFSFEKIAAKSSGNDWFGMIKVMKNIDYKQIAVYQLTAIAKDNNSNFKRQIFEIIVLPNFNKPLKVSRESHLFIITENKMDLIIGKLNLDDAYDENLKSTAIFQLVLNSEELKNAGISYDDIDFQLISKYIYIEGNNVLKTKSAIDRDLYEFTSINGILNLWAKVYTTANPTNLNYFKVQIIFTDLNDNSPSLALVNNESLGNQFQPFVSNQEISYHLNENEIGIIDFDIGQNLIAYDKDLADNSKFLLTIFEVENSGSLKLTTEDLNYYFNFHQTILNNSTYNFVLSETSINFMNVKAFDYELLNLDPIYDPVTGVGRKLIKFKIGAKECSTKELFLSNLLTVSIVVNDLNDNKPIFSQNTYYASIERISSAYQKVVDFKVFDNDSGDYGISGLKCSLLGDGADKFFVDANQQAIYLTKMCTTDCTDYNKALYYFTLVCQDDKGRGHSASTSVLFNFHSSIYSKCFDVKIKRYYLLASGTYGIDIPNLNIKITNQNDSNKLQFNILDITMKNFFAIDADSNFKIISNQLRMTDSPYSNGTFNVPISITDSQGCLQSILVTVQLSTIVVNTQCPKISEQALCSFAINKTNFDPNRIRFCFYNSNMPAFNVNSPNSQSNFYNKIYFSLLPNSPDYLFINSYDGCVKILPSFNLEYSSTKSIEYSIGAFNPGYPHCIHTNKKSCLITIKNPNIEPLKCQNQYEIATDNTDFLFKVTISDINSKIFYSIVKEQRIDVNGVSATFSDNFYFQIDSTTGRIVPRISIINIQYSNILITVKAIDLLGLSTATTCLIEFRFKRQTVPKIPEIIGSLNRQEELCEDIPVNSLITKLNSFDTSLTNQSLCYSIQSNNYFKLQNETCYSSKFNSALSSGEVLLKKSLINYNRLKNNNPLTFVASLYFCYQLTKLQEQVVTVKVNNVNKYAPQLIHPSSNTFLMNNVQDSLSIQVMDYDDGPYDYFKCNVENDNRFVIVNNYNKKTITLTLKDQNNPFEEFIDLGIKCCDDSNYWGTNNCFSVPKCSLKPVRIQFSNQPRSINCANDKKVVIISDNIPRFSEIYTSKCFVNHSQGNVEYQFIESSDNFQINKLTGVVSVSNELKYKNISAQQLKIKCSNGLYSAICPLELQVIPDTDLKPIWIYPNLNFFYECIVIDDTFQLGRYSLISQVQAYSPGFSNIEYAFVKNNYLRSYIYEFKIENDGKYGRIVLNENIDRKVNLYREITLAATITLENHKTITSYQYICIKILSVNKQKPCFQRTPDGSIWPYRVQIKNNNNICFTDQLIKVNNKNVQHSQVYYYLIDSNKKTNSKIISQFEIDIIKGIVCYNNKNNFNLITEIIDSAESYDDPIVSNQICVNLHIIATNDILSSSQRQLITYDAQNCSFNYLKLCTIKPIDNTPPKFSNKHCETVILLDKLNPLVTSCAYYFEFEALPHQSLLNYEIESQNTNMQKDIFSADNSRNCLSINKITEIDRKFLVGQHQLNIEIKDQYNRTDKKLCNFYVTDSCDQRINVYSRLNYQVIKQNITSYLNYLSKISSDLIGTNITALNSGIYSYQNNNNDHQVSESIMTVLFFNNQLNQFLNENQIAHKLNSRLSMLSSSDFKIFKIKTSCLQFAKGCSLQKIGVGLTAGILGLLLMLIPFLLFCLLCYSFKILKYQDNRIIMTQRIIPILEDAQSNYPNDCNNFNNQLIDVPNRDIRFQEKQCPYIESSRPEPNGFNQELLQAIRKRPLLSKPSILNRGGNSNNEKQIYENFSLKLAQSLEINERMNRENFENNISSTDLQSNNEITRY